MASNAEKQVVVVMVTTTGLIFAARLASNVIPLSQQTSPEQFLLRPGQLIRISVGGSVVMLALLVLAIPAPDLAKMLAWLLLIGVLIGYGTSVATLVSRLVSQSLKSPSSPGTSQVPVQPLIPAAPRSIPIRPI